MLAGENSGADQEQPVFEQDTLHRAGSSDGLIEDLHS